MQTGKLESKKPLSIKPLSEPSLERPVSFEVKCTHSIYKKKLFFHNRIRRIDNTPVADSIESILRLDGKTVNGKEIPIEIVEGYDGGVRLNKRLHNILAEYCTDYRDNDLYKYSPKTIHKVPKDYLRYIVYNDGNKWIVILIDPWHLFATNNYVKYFRNHDNRDDRRYGIENIPILW